MAHDFPTAFYACVECALWSSHDYDQDGNGGENLDANYDESDLTDEARAEMAGDLAAFIADNSDDLEGMDDAQIGHDFWLTRNGHGAGFWDRGLGERGERLTRAAKVYGSVDLYVTDDNKIGAQ